MADSVLPGLNPYQPNQSNRAAASRDGEIVRHHGSAAVALELAAQARSKNDGAGQSDEAADGVDHGGSGEIVEAGAECRARKLPALPMVARKPSGPQAQ